MTAEQHIKKENPIMTSLRGIGKTLSDARYNLGIAFGGVRPENWPLSIKSDAKGNIYPEKGKIPLHTDI